MTADHEQPRICPMTGEPCDHDSCEPGGYCVERNLAMWSELEAMELSGFFDHEEAPHDP